MADSFSSEPLQDSIRKQLQKYKAYVAQESFKPEKKIKPHTDNEKKSNFLDDFV